MVQGMLIVLMVLIYSIRKADSPQVISFINPTVSRHNILLGLQLLKCTISWWTKRCGGDYHDSCTLQV